MICHIVLFGVRSEVSEAERESVITTMRALPHTIPEIRRYEVMYDEVGSGRSASFGVLSHFDDFAALQRYRIHPDHQAVLVQLETISEWIKSWDYTIP